MRTGFCAWFWNKKDVATASPPIFRMRFVRGEIPFLGVPFRARNHFIVELVRLSNKSSLFSQLPMFQIFFNFLNLLNGHFTR